MTNEEAIKELKRLSIYQEECSPQMIALGKAIKALEREEND